LGLGLKDVRLHDQKNRAILRFQRVALSGAHDAAHAGQTVDSAGRLLAHKRDLAMDDEQRGCVRGRRVLGPRSSLKMETGQMGLAGVVGQRDESGPLRAEGLQRIGGSVGEMDDDDLCSLTRGM
jgi:hypothetical protein